MIERAFHALQVRSKRPSGNAGTLITIAVPRELQSLYQGLPGQHIVVRARIAGAEVRRTYSLICPVVGQTVEIAVRTEPAGAMSRYLSDVVEPGDLLEVMPPTGSFQSRLTGKGPRAYLMVAAGSGITPVLALLRAKLEQEPDCTCTLLYGNRDTARMLCREEVLALKDRFLARLSLYFFMSREPQAQSRFNGRIDAARLQDFMTLYPRAPAFDECFVCVPSVQDGSLQSVLQANGVAGDRIHWESFTTTAQGQRSLSGAAAEQPASTAVEEGSEVAVTIVMGGRRRTFATTTTTDSVLSAGLAAGLDLPYSCCGGVCSTCRARIVEGEVEMAQNYALEDWEVEAGFVLVCQSRAVTPTLVVDYDSV